MLRKTTVIAEYLLAASVMLVCLTRNTFAATPYIAEFMANNTATLTDDFGTKPDWIEIHNPDSVAVNLLGYCLTDDKTDLKKWKFPSMSLAAGARLVVFASNRNLTDPTPPHKLHTNFKLSEDGEYLALTHIESDGSIKTLTEFNSFPLQFKDVSYGTPSAGGTPSYLNSPTPGAPNSSAKTNLGPLIYNPTTQPASQPLGNAGSPPMLITAEVRPSIRPVGSVSVAWRIMYGAETITPMLDNGAGGDAVSGDNIYSARIPTTGVGPGQMIRWRIIANDSISIVATQPPYSSATDSDQYFGTVAVDTTINSRLPLVCTFMQDTVNCDTSTGTRCSMYFKNTFYDNVFIAIHGQTTQTFPKKSNGINFNSDNACQFFDGLKKVKGINFLSNYADKSKSRVALSWEYTAKMGSYAQLSFPVRVQRNGSFYRVADAVEQGDEVFLDRVGLDPDGALYKIYNDLSSTTGSEKKTRVNEDSSDLQTMINNLDETLPLATRRKYLYDNINIPQCIAYLAAMSAISDWDIGDKNMYMYRDSNISGEWCVLPWDLDLSWGREWYGDDTIYNNNIFTFKPTTNRLFDLFYAVPEVKMMYMRRLRTNMDNFIQPPNTASANGIVETSLRKWLDQMDPPDVGVSDADMDFSSWPNWGNNNNMRTEAQRIFDNHLPGRRSFLYTQNPTLKGEPIPSAAQAHPALTFDTVESNPSSGTQEQEYFTIKNSNAFAVDMSGWTIDGGVTYYIQAWNRDTSRGGTTENVGLLYVVRNPAAFRQRTTGPRAGQFCFTTGPYDGQLSGRGETINLYDNTGTLIATKTFPANPTRSQQSLRITELNYSPTDPTAAELISIPALVAADFEYVELTNLGSVPIDLSGAVISKGVDYTFPAGITLNAGQSTLVVGNLTAFRLRYGNTPRVAGEFSGNLDNTGEALKLTDSSGETVLEFTYDGTWLPITNKGGYTLCARTPTITPYDGYNEPTAWAASGALAGSPGTLDPYFTITYKSWLNDHFTLVEQMNSALAGAVADPDNDGQSTYKEYLLGTNPRLPDVPQLPSWAPMTINGTDYGTISFNRRLHAIDINLIAEAATTPELVLWESTLTQVGDPVDIGNGMERVIFQDNMPLSQSKRVLRVRDSISGIVWVAPFSQSISFDTLPDIQYTLEPIQLFASSDSGLAVNFKIVSGPALLNSGNAIQVIGIGVVTISANQPGNAGYLAAPEITRAFNVAKGDQTIDFPAIEDQFFSLEPIQLSAQASSRGPVAFSISSGPATLEETAVTFTDTGSITITASQAGSDLFNPAPDVQRTFQVLKGAQFIDFVPPGPAKYLDPPITLSATSSEGYAVEFQLISGPGLLNGDQLTILGVGTIVIEVNQPGDNRVASADPVRQSIVVNKATPQINWIQPADVPSGTLLSVTQLNAVASIAGTYDYSPSLATILHRGDTQLSVVFMPADSANFESASATTIIHVLNAAPEFDSTPSAPVGLILPNQPISFAASASDDDDDAITYRWDFGDGGIAFGASPAHTYTSTGTYTVKVTISDGQGGSVSSTFVTNVALGCTVTRATVALNFAKMDSDKIVVAGSFQSPTGTTAATMPFLVQIGGVTETSTFDPKGKVKTAKVLMTIATAKKDLSKFSLTWSKTRFPLETMGFVNVSVKKGSASLSVLFKVGTILFQSNIPMTYTGTAGKKGAGKYTPPKK